MIDHQQRTEDVPEAPDAPAEWVDTAVQRQLRECLTNIMSGHDEITTIVVAGEVITVMRDQLMGVAAGVRRAATRAAKENLGMTLQELAKATHQTQATIARLLTESRPV